MLEQHYDEHFQLEDTHWWFVGRRRILLELLDQWLGRTPRAGRELLDVGCGTGTLLLDLAGYGNARGLDNNEHALQYCRKRGLTSVQKFDGGVLPFQASTFDVVTMFDVLEHIGDEKTCLSETWRVLKPGSTLMLTVPAYRFLWGREDEICQHERRYVATGLRKLLMENGFRIRKLSYFNTLLFPAIAGIRILRRLMPSGMRATQPKSDLSLPTSEWLNRLLGNIFASERLILRRFDIPFGVSIVCIAEKIGG